MKRSLALTTLLAALSTGCIIIPHTSERTPVVHGRVVDAQNGVPVNGAKIHWLGDSSPTAISDSGGFYTLRATKNFHAVALIHNSWPDSGSPDLLSLAHPDYRPISVDPYRGLTVSRKDGIWELRDIKLEKSAN
ncbi:MAG: hypothetical protein ABMA26_04725 [Limisphaerales bacterium]